MRRRHAPRTSLPDYNDARGGLYGSFVKPPFDFRGTQLQVFPLRAKINRLQTFIDGYLNVAPEEAGEFRVFSPFVYLVSIYYGKLSLDASNCGWIAQDELLFGIPLLWYKRVRGRLVFHDFACVTPFIYVDSDHSLTTGRETFGWPKLAVTTDPLASSWIKDPDGAAVLARFSSMVFSELYAGRRQTPQPLLEIVDRRAPSTFLRAPFDPRASWLPWVALPKAIAGAFDLAGDGVEMLRALGVLQAQPGSDPDAYAGMLAQALAMTRFRGPGLTFNTLNLKQFHDAEKPELAAYQAITCAPMRWQRIQRAGLLGEDQILRGDASGGFAINLYEYGTAPILQSLGLEFEDVHTLGTRTVHRLRPVLPLWVEADLQYNLGETLAWRAKDFTKHGKAYWHLLDGRILPPRPSDSVDCRFNNALGAAGGAVTGPFEFPDVTVRVMPLLADESKLNAFLKDYLGKALEGVSHDNPGGGTYTIEAWGSYVYLAASSFEEMSSQTNDLGWWAGRQLVFYVPAVLRKGDDVWKIALVPAYAYADSTTAAVTGPEVNGVPIEKATLESPGDVWMNSEGPGTPTMQTVLTASTTVLPALGLGQKAEVLPFLEVFTGDAIPAEEQERWRGVAEGWGMRLKQELRKRVSTDSVFYSDWAFEVLANGRPLRMLTLKQFRDAENPQSACYQSIVEIEQTITRVHNISEIEGGLYLRMHRHPTLPIVGKLGLVPMMDDTVESGVFTQVFEPLRPFWMRLSLRESLGENLFVHAAPWRKVAEHDPSKPLPPPRATNLVSDEPRRLREAPQRYERLVKALYLRPVSAPYLYGLDDVIISTDPQHFVENVLTEEWERWDGCLWTEAFDRIREERDAACWGQDALEALRTEAQFFDGRGVLSMDSPPGRLQQHRRLRAWCYARYANHLEEVKALWKDTNSPLFAARQWMKQHRNSYNPFLAWEWDPEYPWALARSVQPKPPGDDSALARAFRREADDVSDSLCMRLARMERRRPSQVIRRQTIANAEERERVFPRLESHDDKWYLGPKEWSDAKKLPAWAAYELSSGTDVAGAPLLDSLVREINDKRAAVPLEPGLKRHGAGYVYTGSDDKEHIAYLSEFAGAQGDDGRQAQAFRMLLMREGITTAGVDSFDPIGLTWGLGRAFEVFEALVKSETPRPPLAQFAAVGILFYDRFPFVRSGVDTARNKVVGEYDAFELIRGSPTLLSLLIHLARDVETRDAVTRAQFDLFREYLIDIDTEAVHTQALLNLIVRLRRWVRVSGVVEFSDFLGGSLGWAVPQAGAGPSVERDQLLAVLVGRYFYGKARQSKWTPDWKQFKRYWEDMKDDGLDCTHDAFYTADGPPDDDPFATHPDPPVKPASAGEQPVSP